ncbi:MAG: phage portal protein [Proteobacteria bacterium]|nr:phage portal protein [Pseudomonadota bacterium]
MENRENAPVILDARGEAPSWGRKDERSGVTAFSFGEPEPIVDSVLGYLDACYNPFGDYYEPPLNFGGLARVWRQSPVMESAQVLIRNVIVNNFPENHPLISRYDMEALVLDYRTSGNGFLRRIYGGFGHLLALRHVNFQYVRRRRARDRYLMLFENGETLKFGRGEIIHVREYGQLSDIYGLPTNLGVYNSVWLDEEATLFRRRFYRNGAHLGNVFYVEDETLDDGDEEALKERVTNSKGIGNLRTLFYNYKGRNTKKDRPVVSVIPIGELGTKDEFNRVKNMTENDVMRSTRVFPHGMGGPQKDVQAGDAETSFMIFLRFEIESTQKDLSDAINPHIENPAHKIRWNPSPNLETAA